MKRFASTALCTAVIGTSLWWSTAVLADQLGASTQMETINGASQSSQKPYVSLAMTASADTADIIQSDGDTKRPLKAKTTMREGTRG